MGGSTLYRFLVRLATLVAVILGSIGLPLPAIANSGFGTVREVLLVASGNHPDRSVFLDLEQHRIVSSQSDGDIGYNDATGSLEVAGAEGIVSVAGAFDTLSGPPSYATFGQRAAVSERSVYFVRTRSGQLAKVMVAEVLQPDKQVLRVRYAVQGDTSTAIGDTGKVTVTWGEEIRLPLDGATRIDLERGVSVGAAEGDLLFRDGDLFEAGQGQGIQPVARYEPFAFYQSGFVHKAAARVGLAYIVKTRSGKFATLQIVPGREPHSRQIRVRLQTGEAEPAPSEEDGLFQYSVTIPVSTDSGLQIATGLIVSMESADLHGGPGRTLVALGGGGVHSLGGRTQDLVKEAPEDSYSALSATFDGYTYAIRTKEGKYALLTVTGRDTDRIYADVVYQTDGTRTFFNFVFTEAGDPPPITGGSGPSGGVDPVPPPPVDLPPSGALPPSDVKPTSGWNSLQVEAGASGVTLRWDRPPVDEQIAGYVIWRGPSPDAIDFMVNTQPVTGTSYVDRSIQPNQEYWYRVQAFEATEELGIKSNAQSTVAGATATNRREIWLQVDNTLAKVNGETKSLQVAPAIHNGFTYVPLRFIGEELGAKVTWSEIEQKVTYELDGRKIDLFIQRGAALINDSTVLELPAPPLVIQGSTLVPVRFVSEQLGAKLTWFGEDRTILIEYPQ